MPKLNQLTKEKIRAAAEVVFHENGFNGARTTLIAKKAGVSRTMLHYYYRTKEDLFQEVLHNSLGFFIQKAQSMLDGANNLKTLIDNLIDLLCDILLEKPGLASFIVNILNEKPELITGLSFIQEEQLPSLFDRLLEKAKAKKEIHVEISGEDLLLNIYGLCTIPYLTAPLIRFKEGRSTSDMKIFIDKRRAGIKTFVWNGIQDETI